MASERAYLGVRDMPRMRETGESMIGDLRKCPVCGVEFEQHSTNHVFCSIIREGEGSPTSCTPDDLFVETDEEYGK